jgi:isocitrate/isopropylmalate dehydrogenase
MILCGAMLMEHLGELEAAQRIRDAVRDVIKEGRAVTPDLGGTSKTTAMTNVIIDHL